MASQAWSDHAKVYEATFENSTFRFGEDALILAGFSTPLKTSLKLLEIACGPGRLARAAARLGFDVTATDYAAGMLEYVKERASEDGVNNLVTRAVDGQTLEGLPDSTFDVAISNFGIFLFPDRCAGWRAALRVLKPGGRLLATSWAAENGVGFLMRYIMEHALAVQDVGSSDAANQQPMSSSGTPSAESPAEKVAPSPPPPNATTDLTLFKQELETCGFENVVVYKVRHEMCCSSGQEYVMGMFDNAGIGQVLRTKNATSVWLCALHFFDLVSQGIDPLTDPMAPPPPTPTDGILPEDMKFWGQPVTLLGIAHVAIAEKKTC